LSGFGSNARPIPIKSGLLYPTELRDHYFNIFTFPIYSFITVLPALERFFTHFVRSRAHPDLLSGFGSNARPIPIKSGLLYPTELRDHYFNIFTFPIYSFITVLPALERFFTHFVRSRAHPDLLSGFGSNARPIPIKSGLLYPCLTAYPPLTFVAGRQFRNIKNQNLTTRQV